MFKKIIEKIIYLSRWLLFPIYIGLSFGFILLTLKFFQEIINVFFNIFTMTESRIILIVLSFIDMSLIGGLLVMVMFSGYENFIFKMSVNHTNQTLSWMGKIDVNTIKNKIASSIVAISSVHLLRMFMEVNMLRNDKILLCITIHLTFLCSAFVMSYVNLINKSYLNN